MTPVGIHFQHQFDVKSTLVFNVDFERFFNTQYKIFQSVSNSRAPTVDLCWSRLLLISTGNPQQYRSLRRTEQGTRYERCHCWKRCQIVDIHKGFTKAYFCVPAPCLQHSKKGAISCLVADLAFYTLRNAEVYY